jgi:hypoxanthine phosphoribosyltransferase
MAERKTWSPVEASEMLDSVVLGQKWSERLNVVLENIKDQRNYLSTSAQALYLEMGKLEHKKRNEGKQLHIIALTRQGVPVLHLLQGVYHGNNKDMPEFDILGLQAGRHRGVTYDEKNKDILKSILRIGDDRFYNVFIDDTVGTGSTIEACQSLIHVLTYYEDPIRKAETAKNYSYATLYKEMAVRAPWDVLDWDDESDYSPDDPKFFSTFSYLAPYREYDCAAAEPAILNPNLKSQYCALKISQLLYEVGHEVLRQDIVSTPKAYFS